ncbi:MAG: HPP family protein, partial [Dehalococcoidia bacterium]|nr:HPP family protein [Dehalococcoidia bacterium]
MNYFAKMRDGATSPPRISLSEIVWSWLGAFLGVTAVSFINYKMLDGTDLVMLITSFGATAVLLFGGIR